MRLRQISFGIFFTFLAFFCSACSANVKITEFSLVGKDSISLPIKRGERVTGKNCVYIYSFIPTGFTADMGKAVEDALIKGNGDVLLDGKIYHHGWWIPFIYGEACFIVEGTVGKFIDNMSHGEE